MNQIADTEAYRMDGSAQALERSVQRIGMEVPACRLFARAGYLRAVAMRVAAYVTDYPMTFSGDSCLLDTALEHAINAFYSVDGGGNGVMQAEQRFARTLINRVADLVHIVVVGPDGSTWDPMSGQTLAQFLRQNRYAVASWRPATDARPHPSAYRRYLASVFLTSNDRDMLGMDVANASIYDGASALAEAMLMGLRIGKKKNKVVLSGTIQSPHSPGA